MPLRIQHGPMIRQTTTRHGFHASGTARQDHLPSGSQPGNRCPPLLLLALVGLAAIATAILVSPALRHLIEYLALRLRDLLGIG